MHLEASAVTVVLRYSVAAKLDRASVLRLAAAVCCARANALNRIASHVRKGFGGACLLNGSAAQAPKGNSVMLASRQT